jgi:hypothetical protein
MVVLVQPVVVAVELELVVAKVAEMAMVVACVAIAKLLGVAGGLVAKEQKMGVDYNTYSQYFL